MSGGGAGFFLWFFEGFSKFSGAAEGFFKVFWRFSGPGCQNLAFQRFEPIIIHDFSSRFRKKTLEKHISKQMRVYEQITLLNEKSKFLKICFPDRKMDFLRGGPIFGEKNGNRNRDDPELDGKNYISQTPDPPPKRPLCYFGLAVGRAVVSSMCLNRCCIRVW